MEAKRKKEEEAKRKQEEADRKAAVRIKHNYLDSNIIYTDTDIS